MPPPGPGSLFPSIKLRDEEGREADLPELPALYGFFKTTCPTSEFAWPFLDRIRERAEGGSLSVVGVSQDDPENSSRFTEFLKIRIPTFYDPEPWQASESLGLEIVPTLILVGEDGRVRETVVGFQRDKMEQLAVLASQRAGRPATALFAPGENVPAIKPG
ncbi:MAG TPA: TlpA disulfide reductase family protein [Thermoanaerobaculia bacterium]|nr:TlpA disulfide reductase family protein [Thermoanaerobaculia bacterium]